MFLSSFLVAFLRPYAAAFSSPPPIYPPSFKRLMPAPSFLVTVSCPPPFSQMANICIFLRGCRTLGLGESIVFETVGCGTRSLGDPSLCPCLSAVVVIGSCLVQPQVADRGMNPGCSLVSLFVPLAGIPQIDSFWYFLPCLYWSVGVVVFVVVVAAVAVAAVASAAAASVLLLLCYCAAAACRPRASRH